MKINRLLKLINLVLMSFFKLLILFFRLYKMRIISFAFNGVLRMYGIGSLGRYGNSPVVSYPSSSASIPFVDAATIYYTATAALCYISLQ